MSLKVPKANNLQLFKEGYKVRLMICICVGSIDSLQSNYPASRMQF